MVKHEGGKWVLYTKDGSRKLGTHDTEGDALAQERAVEAGKHRGAEDNDEIRFLDKDEHGYGSYPKGDSGSPSTQDAGKVSEAKKTLLQVFGQGRAKLTLSALTKLSKQDLQKAHAAYELIAKHSDSSADRMSATATARAIGHAVKMRGASMLEEEFRQLHLVGAAGRARVETYDGRDHLVVPVVALMEGVIHAINAETPEFVPLASLAKAAQSWNGRPAVLGHPAKNGRQISANDPLVLAQQCIGTMFNSRVEGTRLLMDAYLDPVKVERVGGRALLERVKAGDAPIEVSVGAFVVADPTPGEHNGKPYKAVWQGTTGDHLAFLPNGRGACSVEMGCGAHRAAMLVTAEGWEETVSVEKPSVVAALKKRILALFDTPEQAASEEAAELVGYEVLRTHLDAAGKAWDEASALIDDLIADETENPALTPAQEEAETEVEDARLGALMSLLSAMVNSASLAISKCMDLAAPDPPSPQDPRYMEALRAAVGKTISAKNMKTVQAAHDSSHAMHGHTVQLGAECNGMKLLAAGSPCKCGGVPAEQGDTDMKTKNERIAALIVNEYNPLKNQVALEANTDEGLRLLEVHCENAAAFKVAADKLAAEKAEVDAKLKAAEAKQMTEAEFMAAAPASIKTLIERTQAADAAQKAALVVKLAAASSALTKEQLETKTLEDLQTLAAFAKVDVDYSARGAAVPHAAETPHSYAAPDPYAPGLKALREQAVN